jgi:ABC-type uncharacterized transport system ATPase component
MITKDGYAAVPWGNRFVIIYNGEQIHDVASSDAAAAYIKQLQEKNKPKDSKRTGTRSKSKGTLTEYIT